MAWEELTTRQVARLLSVSEATIKRWADKGLLAAERTAGGHRRFRAESVARFLRDGMPEPHGEPPDTSRRDPVHARDEGPAFVPGYVAAGAARADASSLSIFDALVNGREREAAAFLINAYTRKRHHLAHIFDEILAPLMKRVGELWYQGELTVAQEHMATRTALHAIHDLRESVVAREPNGLLAVCCGMEGDFHELAVQLLQLLLESEGWRVISLGANTPFFALTEAMLQHRPALVCISSTISHNPDRAAREYEEVLRTASRIGAAIALGGAGLKDQQWRRRFPADLYADDLGRLAEFAASLVLKSSPAPAEGAPPVEK